MKWPHRTNHRRGCPMAAASLLLHTSLGWALVIAATLVSATIVGGIVALTIILNHPPTP